MQKPPWEESVKKHRPFSLSLHLLLELIVAQGGRGVVIVGVIIKVAEGGKEGALLGLGLLEVHLLERLLVKSSL